MWNDTDTPLAFLFTFRCYGTWLHGDERGSVDRFHNKFGMARIEQNESWQSFNSKLLKHKPVILDSAQRKSVEKSILENCKIKNWALFAENVRTNHVHIVAKIGNSTPENALISFKANATKQMRQDGNWLEEYTPWAEKGSKRRLWNERHIELAIEYVINGQGDDLPEFD